MDNFGTIVSFIRNTFNAPEAFVPLHAPTFAGNEKKYLIETIDSTFVSSVGAFVDRFEAALANYTGAAHAIACVNGTNALHISLLVSGVAPGDEVITQALTFIATANAISYSQATPIFVDVDLDTLGMSPQALQKFLEETAIKKPDGYSYNKNTGKKISACVPMHTFGLALRIDEIAQICKDWNIALIEDAAESLGTSYKGVHTGRFGTIGTFSFNGNKTITSGGGGALITDDAVIAQRIKHLTTQAKVPHPWEYKHDSIGYNYRMPNLNAALLCAQMEQLPMFIENKRMLSTLYQTFFTQKNIKYISEIENSQSNYWLNAIQLENKIEQQAFLEFTNKNGVMTRPIWDLMNTLPMFKDCQHDGLANSQFLADRIVNIPSSVRL